MIAMEPDYGAIVLHLGQLSRYVGGGRYMPIETPLEKQRGIADAEMTSGMRAAAARHGRELVECD